MGRWSCPACGLLVGWFCAKAGPRHVAEISVATATELFHISFFSGWLDLRPLTATMRGKPSRIPIVHITTVSLDFFIVSACIRAGAVLLGKRRAHATLRFRMSSPYIAGYDLDHQCGQAMLRPAYPSVQNETCGDAR
jgi:hypothetical protein